MTDFNLKFSDCLMLGSFNFADVVNLFYSAVHQNFHEHFHFSCIISGKKGPISYLMGGLDDGAFS